MNTKQVAREREREREVMLVCKSIVDFYQGNFYVYIIACAVDNSFFFWPMEI